MDRLRKNIWLMAIPIACAVLSVFTLLYELENYIPHADSGFFAMCIGIVGSIIAVLPIIVHMISAAARKRLQMIDRAALLTAAVCLAVCGCAALLANSIPLCPQCEGITAQELGLLAHWIKAGP